MVSMNTMTAGVVERNKAPGPKKEDHSKEEAAARAERAEKEK